MEIPDYKAKAIYSHFKRIIEKARCDISDTRTANALRLARQDLRYLRRCINQDKNDV